MINSKVMRFDVEGTSALKSQAFPSPKADAAIIPFPNSVREGQDFNLARFLSPLVARTRRKALSVLEASEMYCSLRFEDFRGCAYGIFNRKGICALTLATSAMAVASLVFGA